MISQHVNAPYWTWWTCKHDKLVFYDIGLYLACFLYFFITKGSTYTYKTSYSVWAILFFVKTLLVSIMLFVCLFACFLGFFCFVLFWFFFLLVLYDLPLELIGKFRYVSINEFLKGYSLIEVSSFYSINKWEKKL